MGIISQREAGRERQTEMFFQLLFLISPALGMPSKAADVGAEVVNKLQAFIDFSKETVTLLDNSDWINSLLHTGFISLENTEQNLLDLEVELKTMPYADMTKLGLKGNLFPEYNNAKRYLRETGQKLRQFAYKTVGEVRDLKTLFGAVDESEDSVLFLIAIEKMTSFMNDALGKFGEANEKYRTAKKTFVNLMKFSTGSKEKVEKMLKTDSAEYNNWMKVVKKAVREENKIPEREQNLKAEIDALFAQKIRNETRKVKEAAKTEIEQTESKKIDAEIKTDTEIEKEIAEIQAKFEAEKEAALQTAIAEIQAQVEADIEFEIERYNAKLENLKVVTDAMLESGESFERTIDNAMTILEKTIAKITMSTESANVVSKNKDKYPQEFLTKYQHIRSELKTELDDLKNSAETFLAKE